MMQSTFYSCQNRDFGTCVADYCTEHRETHRIHCYRCYASPCGNDPPVQRASLAAQLRGSAPDWQSSTCSEKRKASGGANGRTNRVSQQTRHLRIDLSSTLYASITITSTTAGHVYVCTLLALGRAAPRRSVDTYTYTRMRTGYSV